jgi:hypothetical protein
MTNILCDISDTLNSNIVRLEAKELDAQPRPYKRKIEAADEASEGYYLSLVCLPYSPQAVALVAEINGLIRALEPPEYRIRQEATAALGAVLADLFAAADSSSPTYGFRSMAAGSFSGEAIGFRGVSRAVNGLERLGFIIVRPGIKHNAGRKTRGDAASRFLVQQALIDRAAAHGITPDNWGAHFRQRPRPISIAEPITLRKARGYDWGKRPDRGEPMPIDWTNPKAIAARKQVDELNHYFASVEISAIRGSGTAQSDCHYGFKRIFNEGDDPAFDYDRGGRLFSVHGGFQQLSKAERSTIFINGEPTVELDMRASQLTILHAKLGRPLDQTNDPYGGIGVDRDISKMLVMQTLGNRNIPSRWSPTNCKRYKKDQEQKYGIRNACLRTDHPFETYKTAMLKQFPILNDWEIIPLKWAQLQFEESEVIIETVHILAAMHDIAALPVHDSLIVAVSAENTARKVLSQVFESHFGTAPHIKSN